jgi:hypothetical protein
MMMMMMMMTMMGEDSRWIEIDQISLCELPASLARYLLACGHA